MKPKSNISRDKDNSKFVPLTCDNCAAWKCLLEALGYDPCEECRKMGWGLNPSKSKELE
jgi:hypothetical protein